MNERFVLKPIKRVATINDEALGETTDPDFELQYIDIGNVDSNGNVLEIATYRFEAAPSRARRIVRDGDVIISTVRTYLQAIASIKNPPSNLIVSTGFAVVRPSVDKLDVGYCKYALHEPRFIQEVVSRSVGVSYPAITAMELANIPIIVPPIAEQQAIADYLDRETAQIASLIAAKERLLELLAEKRRAVITHAVTRGLNGDVSLRDSGVEWLGEIPNHWKTVGFTKYLDSWIDYRGHTPEKTVFGVFLVTARNIRNGIIDYEISKEYVSYDNYDDVMSRGKPKIGDLLLTMEAPLGQTALIDREDVALAQRVIKLDYNKQVLLNEFVMYWIMSDAFQSHIYSWATGSTALGIKASKLSELINVIPPIEEQKEIIDYIKHQEEQIKKLASAIERTMRLLHERRDSLIAAAVSGQIKVV